MVGATALGANIIVAMATTIAMMATHILFAPPARTAGGTNVSAKVSPPPRLRRKLLRQSVNQRGPRKERTLFNRFRLAREILEPTGLKSTDRE